MWHCAWILGTLLACAFGVITALTIEQVEVTGAKREAVMVEGIARLCQLMDKSPLRALSFLAALLSAGCMFWEPSGFTVNSGQRAIWQGLLLMWAVCSGVIH